MQSDFSNVLYTYTLLKLYFVFLFDFIFANVEIRQKKHPFYLTYHLPRLNPELNLTEQYGITNYCLTTSSDPANSSI